MDNTLYFTQSTQTLTDSSPALLAMGMGMFLFMFLIFAAAYVYSAICLCKIFKKAGTTDTWAGWVPFYNVWKLFELGDFNGALSLLILIPFVGQIAYLVISLIAEYRIGLKFGKSGEFVLLAIFVSPVWFGILAFGDAKWNGHITASASK